MDWSRIRKKFAGKLLFIDIETSFAEVLSFHIGSKVRLCHDQIVRPSRIICISYKVEGWKNSKTMYWDKNQEDAEMLKKFVKIAEQYPILVGQNGDNFDIKTIKGRLFANQIQPMTNVLSLDTLKMSRQNMKLMSHTLDYKHHLVGGAGKMHMSKQDWIDIYHGKREAVQKMGYYNRIDVEILQDVFWKLLPYVDKLPINLSVLISGNREGCPKCSSLDKIRFGSVPSNTGPKQKWKCKECKHVWNDTRLKSTTDKLGVFV